MIDERSKSTYLSDKRLTLFVLQNVTLTKTVIMIQTKNILVITFCMLSNLIFSQNGVQIALSKITSGQVDEAILLLDSLVQLDSENAQLYGTLGFAYQQKNDFVKSIQSFEKSLELNPDSDRTSFQLGLTYATAKDLDKSFEILMRLKEKGTYNVNTIGASAHLFGDDPRYRLLFPSKEEFSNPFVEEVEIIHEWIGESPNDQFGWIARNIGDVDEDGFDDMVTSSIGNNEGGQGAGKIYVYSGKTGKLLWSQVGEDENGNLGLKIEMAGDVNADGIPDVVATAPQVNKVFIYSGHDGKLIWKKIGNDPKGAFGRSAKGLGDVNNDGHSDILVGEPYQIWGAPINGSFIEHAGKFHILSGKDGSILKTWEGEKVGDGLGTACGGSKIGEHLFIIQGAPNAGDNNGGKVYVYKDLSDEPAFVIEADSTGRRLGGMFLSLVGDVDADGIPDIYASDWANAALGRSTGRVYIHSGATGERLFTWTGESAGDGFGIGVSDAGDVNKDGYDDIITASWQYGVKAPSGGKCYLYSGKDGRLMREITGKVTGETFGFDTTNLGDINEDGFPDFLLTSAYSSINGYRSGRVYLISGKVK